MASMCVFNSGACIEITVQHIYTDNICMYVLERDLYKCNVCDIPVYMHLYLGLQGTGLYMYI